MNDEQTTPETRAKRLSGTGMTYAAIAADFNQEKVQQDGEPHVWTRGEIESLVNPRSAAASTPEPTRSQPPKAEAAVLPTIVLDAETRRAIRSAADSADRASFAASSAAKTFRGFYHVLIAYLVVTLVAGIIVGIAISKGDDEAAKATISAAADATRDEEDPTFSPEALEAARSLWSDRGDCMDDDDSTVDLCYEAFDE